MARTRRKPPTQSTDSPHKAGKQQSGLFSTRSPNLKVKRRELRFRMSRKYVILPHADFLKKFVPPSSEKRGKKCSGALKEVPVAKGKEKDMYNPIANALNKGNLCPGFTFVVTPSRYDTTDVSKEMVDIGLYPSDRQPPIPRNSKTTRATDWSAIDLCVEVKTESYSHDPFDDKNHGHLADTAERKNVLGQILSYPELVFKRQQRTCVFLVLILGEECRILRFDRSGVVVTEKFNYKKTNKLVDFLWRYARLSDEKRGHDQSAERVLPDSDEARAMRARAAPIPGVLPGSGPDYPRELFAKSLDVSWSWWKLTVTSARKTRKFLVAKPHFLAPGLAGRGTRGYVAIEADEPETSPFYYLKDAWRVVSDNIDTEGHILRTLNRQGVRYVPTLVCHGDVPKQETRTQTVWKAAHPDKSDSCPLKSHRHYRLVVEEIGKPMQECSSSRQLCYALLCCLRAHADAYKKAHIIHRDISAGNVLLWYNPTTAKWEGLLNDWELSKQTLPRVPTGRQPDRTGTWQFMSASALNSPEKMIVIEDELESLLHVMLFFAIRFFPHNCQDVGAFMFYYFDDYTTHQGGSYTCGLFKLNAMRNGCITVSPQDDEPLRFMPPVGDSLGDLSHPLNQILDEILPCFKAVYALRKSSTTANSLPKATTSRPTRTAVNHEDDIDFEAVPGPSRKRRQPASAIAASKKKAKVDMDGYHEDAAKLADHEYLDAILADAIMSNGWPESDKVEDQMPKHGYDPEADLDASADQKPKPEHGSKKRSPSRGTSSKAKKTPNVKRRKASH